MSRIGNQPIIIPSDVTLTETRRVITITGTKGVLTLSLPDKLKLTFQDNQCKISTSLTDKKTKAIHGLTRALIHNAVKGVSQGWDKSLQLVGVGFRAQTDGQKLTLHVGFSHPVVYDAPPGISFAVKGNDVLIAGFDKYLVGEVTARIRRIKPPEVYKGKGIRYKGEQIKLKPGKAAKTVGASTTSAAKK